MRYEIINPSDKCYIFAEDAKIAIISLFCLGRGMYGLRDETGNIVCGAMEPLQCVFKMPDDQIADFIEANKLKIAECLESFQYHGEPTSLNNIGELAKKCAKLFRERN